LLCWAATASNVLEWTGWGLVSGMWNSDEMFAHFQDHWTDEGSLMEYGRHWWFDGTEIDPGDDWASVDVAGGGNFWSSYTFSNYYHEQNTDSSALSAIDSYLHSGYGVGLGIYTDTGGGHAITCWGYNYNATHYLGVWVTDSDDSKSYLSTDPPPDRLRYYEVVYNDNEDRWHLQDLYGSDNWWIGTVQALERFPSNRPVADAAGPYIAYEGDAITFDASGSTDADGDTIYYRWDFDNDKTWDTGWQSSPYYTYTYPDHYSGNVVLQVYANQLLDKDTTSASISDAAPIADIMLGSESTITFEELVHNQNVGSFYSGITFTGATCVESPYYTGYLFYPPHSGSKIIYTTSPSMRIDFEFTVAKVGGWFSSASTVYIEAYDVWDNLIGSTSFIPGLYTNTYADVRADGIKYVIIQDAGNYWSLDDLSYVPQDVRIITFEETSHNQVVGSFYPDVTFTDAIALESPYYSGYLIYPPHSGDKLVYTLTGSIRVDFDYTVSKFGGWFTSNYVIYLEAYDEYGTLLDVASVQSGQSTQAYAEVVADGIKYVIIHDAGNYWTMDDIVFTPEWVVVDEGYMLDFTGWFYDQSPSDTHTFEWDFGDSSTQSGTLSVSHAYGDNGVFIISLTVTDDDGLFDTSTFTVVSINVAPMADILTESLTCDEGDVLSFVGSYTDPGWLDTHTIEWDFGDGNFAYGALTPTHAYGDNGIYTVTLTVTDDDGGVGSDSITIQVLNVAPTVWGSMIQPNPQFILPLVHNLTFYGRFSDPGWLDSHTLVWDFGDGTTFSGIDFYENEEPDAWGNSTAYHVYILPGVYTVILTVEDDDGGVGIFTFTVTVSTAQEALQDLAQYIDNLPDDAFKHKACCVKKMLRKTFAVIDKLIEHRNYKAAYQILLQSIRKIADGFVDGKLRNDKIIDPEAQEHICMKIDDITSYLKLLHKYKCCHHWKYCCHCKFSHHHKQWHWHKKLASRFHPKCRH
jgi:PKD repeat protein